MHFRNGPPYSIAKMEKKKIKLKNPPMGTENILGMGVPRLFPVITSDLKPITEYIQCPLHPKPGQLVDVVHFSSIFRMDMDQFPSSHSMRYPIRIEEPCQRVSP
jgi:hypothetical protein